MCLPMSSEGNTARLFAYLAEKLGEHLRTLLLAGHGETAPGGRRSLTVTSAAGEEWRVDMTSRGGGPLPHGEDPVVLAALLNLLFRRREERTAAFRPSELLRLLGWADSLHNREALEDAIRRYHDVSYTLSKIGAGRGAGEDREPAQEVRPVAECEFERVPVEGGSKVRSYFVVDFDASFIGQLEGKSLFGIDWGSVTSVNPVAAEGRPRAGGRPSRRDEPASPDPSSPSINARQAAAERRLIEYLERHCGKHLSAILLAGGEQPPAVRRIFLVTSRGERGETRDKYIEFGRWDPRIDLPHGQDPLTLVALIRLLFERGTMTEAACTITVDHTALLRLLGVKDSFEARRLLREALERYENLRLNEVFVRQTKKGPKESGSGHLSRVITYQEAETVKGGTTGWGTRLRIAVEFDYVFVDNLRWGTLFGVDWQRVISVKEIGSPEGV